MEHLVERWTKLCGKYCEDASLIARRWNELKAAYTSFDRYYHNLDHISFMLDLCEEFSDQLDDPRAVEFAIFYHDLVYKVDQTNNEEESAAAAVRELSEMGLTERQLEKISQQILATKLHIQTDDNDTDMLLDIDMAILGEEWEVYEQYAKNVRKEFHIYPDEQYREGRTKVLQEFLDMPYIYKTTIFRRLYEEDARANIRREMANL